jgi:hypothetical protein
LKAALPAGAVTAAPRCGTAGTAPQVGAFGLT